MFGLPAQSHPPLKSRVRRPSRVIHHYQGGTVPAGASGPITRACSYGLLVSLDFGDLLVHQPAYLVASDCTMWTQIWVLFLGRPAPYYVVKLSPEWPSRSFAGDAAPLVRRLLPTTVVREVGLLELCDARSATCVSGARGISPSVSSRSSASCHARASRSCRSTTSRR